MRLQVEIATASWMASWSTSSRQHARRAPVGQRQLLAQRQRRGLVVGADDQELASHSSSSEATSSEI